MLRMVYSYIDVYIRSIRDRGITISGKVWKHAARHWTMYFYASRPPISIMIFSYMVNTIPPLSYRKLRSAFHKKYIFTHHETR